MHSNASTTVVIPVYNKEDFLERCVFSVLQQARMPDRLIIIDNASTDNSLQRARQLAKLSPIIDVLANSQNVGMAKNITIGINSATSDYVSVLCADDCWAPTYLDEALELLQAGFSAVFCNASIYTETNQIATSYLNPFGKMSRRISSAELLWYMSGVPLSSFIFSASALHGQMYYDARFPFNCDLDFELRVSRSGKGIFYLAKSLVNVYVGSANETNRYNVISENRKLLRSYLVSGPGILRIMALAALGKSFLKRAR